MYVTADMGKSDRRPNSACTEEYSVTVEILTGVVRVSTLALVAGEKAGRCGVVQQVILSAGQFCEW